MEAREGQEPVSGPSRLPPTPHQPGDYRREPSPRQPLPGARALTLAPEEALTSELAKGRGGRLQCLSSTLSRDLECQVWPSAHLEETGLLISNT